MAYFPVSGVEVSLWMPPVVAFGVSFFSSMVGISGAFLLMPFQMSVLGYAGPSASATNLVFNLYATVGGVWRYARDRRMAWPLVELIVASTLPGVILGFYVRTRYLADIGRFKLFVGTLLLFLALKLLAQFAPWGGGSPKDAAACRGTLRLMRSGWCRMEFLFGDREYGLSVPALFALAFAVGIIGGIYGIGGGAIIAPFCITIFGLPVAVVAGAALAGTLATSIIGVLAYSLLPLPDGGTAPPDWMLGSLFGVGGFAGMYLGAAVQKYVPQNWLKIGLGAVLLGLGASYVLPAL